MTITPRRHAAHRSTYARNRAYLGLGLAGLMLSGGVLSATSALATDSTGAVVTVPAAIPHDCSRNVTPALNRWVQEVPDGSTINFPAGGCYEVDGHFVVGDRNDLTFNGNGATLEQKTVKGNSAPMMQFVGGSNLTVENLTLLGANPTPAYNPSLEFSGGLKIAGVDGATIQNMTIQHMYGDFMTIENENATPAQNITVTGGNFDVAGRQGISVVDADGVDINGVTLGNTHSDDFDLESSAYSQADNNVTIENTTAFGSGQIWFSAGGTGTHSGTVVVRNNVMTTAAAGTVVSAWAPLDASKSNLTFTGNTLNVGADAQSSALELTRAKNVTFDNNTLNFENAGKSSEFVHESGVSLYQSALEMSYNTFQGAGSPFVLKNFESTITGSSNNIT
jgi:hypothetical protein